MKKLLLIIGIVLFALVIWFYLDTETAVTKDNFTLSDTIERILNPEPKELKILAVGDMMLGRFVETLMNRSGENYPFTYMSEFLSNQDVVLGNLEGPILTNHKKTPDFTTNFSFQPKVAELLRTGGFTHLSIANNHTFDKGESAFTETQKYLTDAGIVPFGHPREASSLYVKAEKINDIGIVWIGLNEAVSKYFDLKDALTLVIEMQKLYSDYQIIVNIHWGTEYKNTSNDFQKKIAHDLIDNGADLIIGHHPHTVQEIENYNGKLIIYSLGNFIFDQYFSRDTQEGLAVNLTISKDGLQTTELIGVTIDKSRPKRMTVEREAEFMTELANRSLTFTPETIESKQINFQ